MKLKDNIKKYNAIIIVACIIIFIYKAFDMSIFSTIINAIMPLIIGGVLAYFLQPLVNQLEKVIKKGNGFVSKHAHTISSLAIFVLFMLLVIITLWAIIPMLVSNIADFAQNITKYTTEFEQSVKTDIHNEAFQNFLINMERGLLKSAHSLQDIDTQVLIGYASKTGSTIITILIGLIFCPYILIEEARLAKIVDKVLLLFTCQENIDLIHDYTYKSHQIFGSFIYGKFIDSVIIGIIALIGLGFLDIRFYPLLAAVILITNMIPYFGPFIGGIPVVFIALITNGFMSAIFTALFIFALQQFDGLFLGPKILGDQVGISPFWIITSITVFGSLFGFIGMFLGVPLICVIRMFFNDFINYQKNKKQEDI